MAWDTEMVTMLRYMIDDVDATQKYSDSRLQTLIVITATQVNYDVGAFSQTYTYNIATPSISPDPTDSSNRDDDFITLVTLKAACTISLSEFRDAARKGISFKQGRSSIDTKGMVSGYKDLIDGPNSWCNMYKKALDEYKIGYAGASGGPGRSIMGPFAGDATSFIQGYYNYPREDGRFN